MAFRFLDLPRELRDHTYKVLMGCSGRKPHVPCLLASCRQIYNEMQRYIQPGYPWPPAHIVIDGYTLALLSSYGPRRSRRARKRCGYSHWDVRALSSLTIGLAYDGIIDSPHMDILAPEHFIRRSYLDSTDNNPLWAGPRPWGSREVQNWVERDVRKSHRRLEMNFGDIYRALLARKTAIDVTFEIFVRRMDLRRFEPPIFKGGISRYLRLFIKLPPRCQLKAVVSDRDKGGSEFYQEQGKTHAAFVVDWFNKRRARWLFWQEFQSQRDDYLFDVRTVFGHPADPRAPPVLENPSFRCRVCGNLFASNNRLHRHIRASRGYTETEDYQDHYQYWYGCSREEVYERWYNMVAI